ncbi:MAG TPA: hypothetical protein VD839_13040 [Burkholderiales bacterium]|jgi:hypothetical protein|nr:hypothetical protein [Burkholderiales bacterium]
MGANCRLNALTRAATLLLVVLLLCGAGCASTTLTSVWRDPGYTGGPLRSVLVMGISEETGIRRIFEDEFSAKLQSVGVIAIPGYTVIPQDGPAEAVVLDAAIVKAGAQGVLITRLLRIERRTNYAPGYYRAVPAVGYYRNFHGYYTSAWVPYAPAQAYDYDIVALETNLWSPRQGELIWSGITESFAPSNVRQATREFADVIIRALREQKLI